MTAIAVFLIQLMFATSVMAQEPTPAPTPVCTTTCSSYTTCTTCTGTCNRCLYSNVADPAFTNKSINNLPFEFNYSQVDLNTSNDTCSSSECGSKTCTGTTVDANKTLPTSWQTGACTLTPNNKIPAVLNCRYKDFYCDSYCSKWESYSCCAAYTTTCT